MSVSRYLSENIESGGFFAALRNRRIHRTLELIHQSPQQQWSLDLLAEQANMSRATLIRQFKSAVGEPPMTYLSKWRMIKAHNLIRHSSKTIDQISEMVEFSSARTLSKAFLNHYGLAPSQFRR